MTFLFLWFHTDFGQKIRGARNPRSKVGPFVIRARANPRSKVGPFVIELGAQRVFGAGRVPSQSSGFSARFRFWKSLQNRSLVRSAYRSLRRDAEAQSGRATWSESGRAPRTLILRSPSAWYRPRRRLHTGNWIPHECTLKPGDQRQSILFETGEKDAPPA